MRALSGTLALLVAGAGLLLAPTPTAEAAGEDAATLAGALSPTPGLVSGAAFVEGPPDPSAVSLGTEPVAGFPRAGEEFVILSTGTALDIYQPDDEDDRSTGFGVQSERSESVYDVTTLRVDLDVPATANCLMGVDFAFFTEEYPEFVGTEYNDAFILEIGESTWTVDGATVTAPRNIAFDELGNPITVNSAGAATMNAENAAGTTFDGGTRLLTAATPLSPGEQSLFFTVFDAGDDIYDSTLLIDNLRVGRVADVETDCRPGAVEAVPDTYVAMGDSYSSGFGVAPYEPGTHVDGGNDCQRSLAAYSAGVAAEYDIARQFVACQGAETRDFYEVRDSRSDWGESPQLSALGSDTALVTFSVGGNDAGFATVLQDCILGWELLPFNTCHGDDRVTEPVAAAFDALRGSSDDPGDIRSYDEIFGDIRTAAPYAEVVGVGYPQFFTAEGSDRTFLPGGRCEGVKKADQRWIVEQIGEINSILESAANRHGYLFADPGPRFVGHELCGGGEEWIFPLLNAGRIHPTAAGHAAMAEEVIDTLDSRPGGFVLQEGETVTRAYVIEDGTVLTSVVVRWPGSDVVTTLVSPSGVEYSRTDLPAGTGHEVGPTFERFELTDPEPGEWTVRMYGAELDDEGEEVTLSTYQEAAPNERPQAVARIVRTGTTLTLDAGGSTDPDGTLTGWDWYVEGSEYDEVITGRTATFTTPDLDPVSVTLVVTDDGGLTDFTTTTVPAAQWVADSAELEAGDDVVVALLSSAELPLTDVVGDRLVWDLTGEPAGEPELRDVDGNGAADLVLTSTVADLGLQAGATDLCLSGELTDGRPFTSCVTVEVAATVTPTPTPSPEPTTTSPEPTAGPTGEPTAAPSTPPPGAQAPGDGQAPGGGQLPATGTGSGAVLLTTALLALLGAATLMVSRRATDLSR